MVGQPITTGYPDTAACMANRSASIFERVYGPGMSSGSNASSATGTVDGDARNRIDSVEQCRTRFMPRLRAASMTISVPP